MPVESIERVVYSYDAEQKGFSNIILMTKEDVAYMEEVSQDRIQAMKDIFRGRNQPMTFTISAMNPVEGLHLEKWFEDRLRKYKAAGNII